MISPLGHSAQESWDNIKAGVSGIGILTRFDTTHHAVKIAAQIKDWDATRYIPAKEARRRDLYQQFIAVALQELRRNSGMTVDPDAPHRTGVIVGSAVGGVSAYYDEAETYFKTGDPRKVTPFGIPMLMVEGGGNMISIDMGAKGPSYAPISACATGADCIGHAFDLIRMGRLDQAVAGCGEAPIIPIGIAAFDRTGACSRLNDTPTQAVKPFDKNRSGLVFSEGAALVTLETLEGAKARGANILAEIVGYASTSDAFHITAPDPDAKGAVFVIQGALDDAKLTPADIDYINAHGTATSLNDAMETKAIKRVFGERAYHVPMSSTKSMTGHAMGATAAMEAVFSTFALQDQIAPPTINYSEPDPECDLDCIPNTAREMPMRHIMSNSFGFGGHNVSLIFRRFDD
jgi:beta-ketoacyl-acyl-carrier-protein synthase II